MLRALLLGIPLALLSAACTYDNGNARRVHQDGDYGGAGSGGGGNGEPPACGGATTPVQTWIDVDAQIDTRPGEGGGPVRRVRRGRSLARAHELRRLGGQHALRLGHHRHA